MTSIERSNKTWIKLAPFVILLSIALLAESAWAQAPALTGFSKSKRSHKNDALVLPVFEKPSDPHSSVLSPDAVQLAETLKLTEKLTKLRALQQQKRQLQGASIPIELRQDLCDIKLEIIEIIEQTRLDIDFVAAEIEEEQAAIEEVLRWYLEERDDRVERANLWAFRTNGILWAVCEGLAIPTYKQPRFAIPSGAIGIVAGLVPSVFSTIAVRSSHGRHHERRAYPNMLTKFYDLPTTPRTEYPESVWTHLNLPPSNEPNRSRRQVLMDHWINNRNIISLKTGINKDKMKILAGVDQTDISIDLLNDRLSMFREIKACVLQMTRPLLELHMCLTEKKQIDL